MKKNYLVVDIETTGLEPLVNEITCIGVLNSKSILPNQFVSGRDNLTEKDILEKFWDYISEFNPNVLIGWNIDNFDWKFLKIRSLLNGVQISKYYKKKERLDLMILLKTPKWQSLNSYTKLLLNDQKMQMNPIDLFQEKKFDELAKFNAKDLELTLKVFEKCVECGVIIEDNEMVESDKPMIKSSPVEIKLPSQLQGNIGAKVIVDEGLDIEIEAKKEAEEKQKSPDAWKKTIG